MYPSTVAIYCFTFFLKSSAKLIQLICMIHNILFHFMTMLILVVGSVLPSGHTFRNYCICLQTFWQVLVVFVGMCLNYDIKLVNLFLLTIGRLVSLTKTFCQFVLASARACCQGMPASYRSKQQLFLEVLKLITAPTKLFLFGILYYLQLLIFLKRLACLFSVLTRLFCRKSRLSQTLNYLPLSQAGTFNKLSFLNFPKLYELFLYHHYSRLQC